MKKDTIVFINISPLGSVFADSLGMELFSQAGYKLVYLDLKKIYYPETYKSWGKENIEYDVKQNFFIECETKDEVLQYIIKYADRSWFFPVWAQYVVSLDLFWMFRAFKKYGCDYILQDYFPQPEGIKIKSKNLGLHFITRIFKNLGKSGFISIMKKSLGWLSFLLLSSAILI